jgi:hypothetical protein
MISVLRSIFGYCQEMSGIKGGKIPEISLSYLIISENRYLQDIAGFENADFCGTLSIYF